MVLRNVLLAVLFATAIALLGLSFVAWRQQVALEQPLQLTEPWVLEVNSGDTPVQLFRQLAEDGRLKGLFWLRLYWRFNPPKEALYTGEYQLRPGMSVQDLMDLWQRHEVVQYNLKVLEGWNFRQLRAALSAQPKLTQSLAGLTDAEVMERLGQPALHPEGRFFPDTYRYTKGVTDLDLLKQAFVRLDGLLNEEWQQRANDLPYENPYQALIVASLIEKETGVAEERAKIAGVFIRRLVQGMLLQTDPTVIYGLGAQYTGNLTRQHLRQPTPYNTYIQHGLPPTPIALPGRDALHAAVHPESGHALYFVARGDGHHVFSATLEEHNQAVRTYQLNRRADYRTAPNALPQSPSVAPPSEEGL